jgi:anaerobic selenocysteine-containing dehydrogenase
MGITHHVHGVDNVESIVNLALLRGMVGKPHADFFLFEVIVMFRESDRWVYLLN